jgi:Zn-dependent protease with chaperone function
LAAPARATMDFFAAQAAAKRRTALLVVYFALAVVGTVAAIWAGLSLVLVAFPVRLQGGASVPPFGGDLAAVVSAFVGLTTLGGYAYHAARLSDGGHAVARMLGGVPVSRATAEAGERRLVNVAEEMAIAAGLPVPALYVLPGEEGINAFAAGLAPDQAVVAVTRGALARLTRDELQGVVAHEYSHVLNGDARLNVRLLSVIGGITAVAAVGRILLRLAQVEDQERVDWTGSRARRRSGSFAGAALAAGLVIWLAGSVGALFGRLIRAAVSRQREHLADASAVQFTRNPDGLAGALAKIAHAGSRVGSAFAPEAAHLFFANGLASEWLATHPPIKERIDRILPNGYLRVMRLAAEAPPPAEDEPAAPAPAAPASAPPALAAVAAPASLTPAAVVAASGRLAPQQVAHAALLLRALPPEVAAAAREPASAAVLVRALVAKGDATVRAARLARLADPATRARVEPLAAALAPLPRELRSAALDLALPALDALPVPEADALEVDLAALAAGDGGTSVFDWAVLRIVRRRRAHRTAAVQPARLRLEDVQVDLLDLLSTVAWAGTRDPVVAQAALDAALPALGIPVGWRVLPRDRVSARRLDAALDRLDGAIPPLKARVLEACAAAALYDGRILPGEAELVRAVAASLGVPVPRGLAAAPAASAGAA